MTTVTIGFTNPEYDAYEDLSIEDARETVMEELKKSIQDQGSDGYDLVWQNVPAGIGDDIERWLSQLTPSEAEEQTGLAHEKGIEISAKAQFSEVWSALVLNGEARLPGGVTITYKEERADGI